MKNWNFKFLPRLQRDNRLHQLEVPIIALTGGIATGKSTVSQILKQANFPIIDADRLIHKIYQHTQTKAFIFQHYPQVKNHDEEINFPALRKILFDQPDQLSIVEEFLYPLLKIEFLNEFNNFSQPNFIIYDVPLLYEKKLDPLVDYKVVVYCSREEQIERIKLRDNSPDETIQKILMRQIDIESKSKCADYIIKNQATLDDLKIEIETFINNTFY